MAFCESCGVQLTDQEKFCHNCGMQTTGQAQVKITPPVPGNNPGVQQFNPAYMPPPQKNMYMGQYNNDITAPLSVGQFILTFILLGIPLLNIVLLFVWGFGSNVNLNKKNLARTILIIGIVVSVLSIVFGSVIVGIVTEIMNNISY